MSQDDLGARLRATFIGELEEQVREMNAVLLVLEQHPRDAEQVRALFRVAHTLKGAAAAAGIPLVERACHALESQLALVRDGKLLLAPSHFVVLFAAADALADSARRLRAGEPLEGSTLASWYASFTSVRQRPVAGAPALPSSKPARDAAAPTAFRVPESGVRVRTDRLDELIASAGVLIGSHRQALKWSGEVESMQAVAARTMTDWRHLSARISVALEERAADTGMHEALAGMGETLLRLASVAEQVSAATTAYTRSSGVVTDDVLRQIRQLRMRPFADACEALPRVARDVAAGRKDVRVVIAGGEVEADRAVLDGLREALVHIVRNAVDHGIEEPEAREKAGKPRTGTVTVEARLSADRVVVTVSDDGAGIDVPAIRASLAQRGAPVPGDDREVALTLFQGGISTRAEPTEFSGRGVGMDLVRAALARVRGSVSLDWTTGGGTTVTLKFPPSIASLRAVLASVGGQTVALPTSDIMRLLRVATADLRRVEGRDVVLVDGTPLPVVALARLLPPLELRPPSSHAWMAVLSAAGHRLALVVDSLSSEEEIVVQSVTRGDRRPPLLAGAALLGSGEIALVIDTGATVAAGLALEGGTLTVASAAEGPARRRVLVVDDSMTTRTLEQGILEAAGFDVRTAVDGADGWRLLQEHGADLVVSDVEMPRMDGFALCEAIRSSKRFRDLPVVLVTALETPEHRSRGLEVGADAYIGKSSFDQRGLMRTINDLLG